MNHIKNKHSVIISAKKISGKLKTKNIVKLGITVIILIDAEMLCIVYIIYGTRMPNEIPVVIHMVPLHFRMGLYPQLGLTQPV